MAPMAPIRPPYGPRRPQTVPMAPWRRKDILVDRKDKGLCNFVILIYQIKSKIFKLITNIFIKHLTKNAFNPHSNNLCCGYLWKLIVAYSHQVILCLPPPWLFQSLQVLTSWLFFLLTNWIMTSRSQNVKVQTMENPEVKKSIPQNFEKVKKSSQK